MFGLSISETFLIFLAAIILLKPTDYQNILKKIASVIRRWNLFWNKFLNEFDLFD